MSRCTQDPRTFIKLWTIHSLTRPHVDYHYHICFQLALQKGLNIRKNEIIEDISWLYFWAKYLYIFSKGSTKCRAWMFKNLHVIGELQMWRLRGRVGKSEEGTPASDKLQIFSPVLPLLPFPLFPPPSPPLFLSSSETRSQHRASRYVVPVPSNWQSSCLGFLNPWMTDVLCAATLLWVPRLT